MTALAIEAAVFDVLGTLVDEPAGIRAGICAAAPFLGRPAVDEMLGVWQGHIEREQQRMADGERPFASSEVLDREASVLVADAVGIDDPASLDLLTEASRRLEPWPDTVAALARIAERLPVIGLSNASSTALMRINAHAGLRWHQILSAETAGRYKPAPEVYRLAVDVAGVAPDRLLMVAAHAWDLRGAQAVGMRTAYVARPVGDPPAASDSFDMHALGLAELADQL